MKRPHDHDCNETDKQCKLVINKIRRQAASSSFRVLHSEHIRWFNGFCSFSSRYFDPAFESSVVKSVWYLCPAIPNLELAGASSEISIDSYTGEDGEYGSAFDELFTNLLHSKHLITHHSLHHMTSHHLPHRNHLWKKLHTCQQNSSQF